MSAVNNRINLRLKNVELFVPKTKSIRIQTCLKLIRFELFGIFRDETDMEVCAL